MSRTAAALLLLLLPLPSCRHHTHPDEPLVAATPTPTPPPVSASASSPALAPSLAPPPALTLAPAPPPGLPPLPGFFEPLPVAGYPDAWISLPTGATSKRPVVVVIHGAGDRPDWQCGGWRHAAAEYPFVVCPRGHVDRASSTRDDVRYTHIGGAPLQAYIDGALEALAARYPEYVDASTPLLAGFSLGAAEVVALAVKSPSRFPRLVLTEGGTNAWSEARVQAFLGGGGQRVLFGSGQEGVQKAAKATARRIAALGLDARVVFARVGHTFDPPLEDAVHQELGWLVAGDERWPAALFEP